MATAATSTEMTVLMLASVSASLAVFYWRDWQKCALLSSAVTSLNVEWSSGDRSLVALAMSVI